MVLTNTFSESKSESSSRKMIFLFITNLYLLVYRKKGTYITTYKGGRSKALVMKSRTGPPSLTTKCSMFLGKTFSAGHGSKRPYSSWLKKKSVCLSKRNTTQQLQKWQTTSFLNLRQIPITIEFRFHIQIPVSILL